MAGEVAPYLDGIPVVADAATRDLKFPLPTRAQDQRVFNKGTGNVERWSGSAWVIDLAGVGGVVVAANVRAFGAKGDGVTDDSAAFVAAIASIPAAVGGGVNGGTVTVPPGKYRFASSLAITTPVRLQGPMGGGWYSGAELWFDAGVQGIVVSNVATTAAIIQALAVYSSGGKSGGGTTVHGIRMIRRAKVVDCRIAGFNGNGLHIVADSASTSGVENANLWRVQDCMIDTNGGHGIYTQGGDANAGVAIGNSLSANGGHGVYESSFLGNCYVGNHTELNTLGSYTCIGAVNTSIFSGNYSEAGQPNNSLVGAPKSMWIGGTSHGFVAGSPRIDSGKSANLTLGSEAWIAGVLQGVWTNAGGSDSVAAHRTDAAGITHLKGKVQTGAVSSSILLIATTRAPSENQTFLVPSNGGVASVTMQSNGSLFLNSNTGTAGSWIALDGIHFTASSFAGVT